MQMRKDSARAYLKVTMFTIVSVASGIVVLVILYWLPVQEKRRWVDPVTGSEMSETFIFGLPVASLREASPLEDWVAERELDYVQRWTLVEGTNYNIFGNAMSFSHAPAPCIMQLKRSAMQIFVQCAPEDEISEFVTTMRSNDKELQHASVERAYECVRRSISSNKGN
jgi:hypothetical protein